MPSRSLSILVASLGLGAFVFAQQSGAPSQPSNQAGSMSFEEYEPRSTLVVPEHPVPRAKFPVIDVHSHHRRLTPDAWQKIVQEMDGLNLQVLVNLSGGSGQQLKDSIDAMSGGPHPDRMVFFANLDFSKGVYPGFGAAAAKQLEADVKAGAKGLKLFKNYGMDVLDQNGARVPVDTPELDPVWAACARLGIPVLIHTGEPMSFWNPVDKYNERWLELTLLPDRRVPPELPTFDELMAERDRLFLRHPKTTFIVAHMGWHANDLGRLGKMLDRMPNIVVETGAILYELGRQPWTAHDFFVEYQDRILFGKDTYRASEFPYYWRVFETRDEYMEYYRKYHAFWRLYGLNLPDEVLRKVYYANALRIVPGIPRNGFPQS